MPSNKNAVVRYKYLDDMLSDAHRSYTCAELWKRCNERLRLDGYPEVTKRTVENDLNDLEGSPFFKEIDRSERKGGKTVLRYRDHSQPLFGKELSDDEKSLLSEILNALDKFSGLESFHWFDDIQERLNDRQRALTTHGTDAGRLRPSSHSVRTPIVHYFAQIENIKLQYLRGANLYNCILKFALYIANYQ